MIFLQSDIDEFNTKYRNTLDDDLGSGRLTSAEAIYQRYYDRFSNRLLWASQKIEPLVKNEKFSGEETIQTDRKKSPWPADQAAADTLKGEYLKNDILNLRLADKPTENIGTTLLRRYKLQLERLNRQTAMENYEVFINAYTELYDPHTNYMSPKTTEDFDISMALSLEGIGAVLEKEDEKYKSLSPRRQAALRIRKANLKLVIKLLVLLKGKKEKNGKMLSAGPWMKWLGLFAAKRTHG
ncbi:MAG: hypothetical protein R3E67_06240 [Pseudomonadales bacterium]